MPVRGARNSKWRKWADAYGWVAEIDAAEMSATEMDAAEMDAAVSKAEG